MLQEILDGPRGDLVPAQEIEVEQHHSSVEVPVIGGKTEPLVLRHAAWRGHEGNTVILHRQRVSSGEIHVPQARQVAGDHEVAIEPDGPGHG